MISSIASSLTMISTTPAENPPPSITPADARHPPFRGDQLSQVHCLHLEDANPACLQKEYCPPIDSALFFAIVSDFDLRDETSVVELRATLDILKENAATQDSTTFDPSGCSGQHYSGSTPGSPDRAQSWHGDQRSTSDDTGMTSLSQSLASFGIHSQDEGLPNPHEEGCRQDYDAGTEKMSLEEKMALLEDMFPEIKPFDISYALKKAGGGYGKAIEDLLNQVFFEEETANGKTMIRRRGVEAFSEDSGSIRGRKAKSKKKQLRFQRRTSSTPAPSSDICSPKPSKWDLAKQDVEYITQRTYLSPQMVSSTYHKSGATLPLTIAALCADNKHENPHVIPADSSIIALHASELATDFPSLPNAYLISLISLTHPSTASAHELARALLSSSTTYDTNLSLIPQYLLRPPSPPSPTLRPPSQNLFLSHDTATAFANTSLGTRQIAQIQANAAYRKSKSSPLIGGAASYYSSVSRDASHAAARYSAAAADALVSSQSRTGEVDLHGVNVKDAVRIARERVESWWENGGREWARAGKVMGGPGLRLVTGIGRHSEGGKGRLGPAVGAMLIREGWRVEVGEGVLTVLGKVRK